MSHYTVAVIVKDINDLEKTLAPYDENKEVEPYIYKTAQQLIEEVKRRKETIDFSRELSDYEKKILECKTDDDYLRCYVEYWDDEKYDFDHNVLSTYNPNSKWDYWVLCELNGFARYKNEKIPKGYCKVKDWPLKFSQEEYDKGIRFWEIIVEGQPLKEGEEKPFNMFREEYLIELYGTKENYATICATPHYWAFVLNGQWYEKGKMGWFGTSDATKSSIELYLEKWKEVINDPQYQDYYIAIVDCHI